VVPIGGKRASQQLVQPAPARQHLRHRQLRLCLPVGGQQHAAGHLHAQRLALGQPGAGQCGAQGVVRHDAGPAPAHRAAHLLQHLHVVPVAQQHVGGKQAAERAADNKNAGHGLVPGLGVSGRLR
jgi:hypothetical protein